MKPGERITCSCGTPSKKNSSLKHFRVIHPGELPSKMGAFYLLTEDMRWITGRISSERRIRIPRRSGVPHVLFRWYRSNRKFGRMLYNTWTNSWVGFPLPITPDLDWEYEHTGL